MPRRESEAGAWLRAQRDRALASSSMVGAELASEVSIDEPEILPALGQRRWRVALLHFGAKSSITRHLRELGCEVVLLPQDTGVEQIRALAPDGLFLSNGPGDPAACISPIATVRELLGTLPIYGICLGHQILALAAGARTVKLPFGHHGANHPVQDVCGGVVAITSQNHCFSVDEASLVGTGFEASHRSLYDGTLEGIRSASLRAASVQFHPEASPGPHDAHARFGDFLALMEESAHAAQG